jgi:diguanylate cyclase (GGDEF)-like protein
MQYAIMLALPDAVLTGSSTIVQNNSIRCDTKRILVVDDQPANILLIREILGTNMEAFAATGGAQALAMCIANPPDLVLLDVQMPGIDGLETCRRLRACEQTRAIPVIFVTGNSSAAEEEACWAAGAADFVTKPINPTTLRNRVRSQLTLREQADQLRRLAFIDGLTGVYNRRYFDDRLEVECRRARRSGTPLSLFMLDVDFFKRYNDHYGHPAGDACLVEIARSLRASVGRSSDTVARFGGEEFVALLPETDYAGAMSVARMVLDRIRELNMPHADSPIGPIVSASIGVSTWIAVEADSSADDRCASLLQEADKQLYRAKQEGRARVVGSESTSVKSRTRPGC